MTNAGHASWADFASELFRLMEARTTVERTRSTEFPSPARRPAYSVLAPKGLESAGIPLLRPWTEALAEFLRARLSTARP